MPPMMTAKFVTQPLWVPPVPKPPRLPLPTLFRYLPHYAPPLSKLFWYRPHYAPFSPNNFPVPATAILHTPASHHFSRLMATGQLAD